MTGFNVKLCDERHERIDQDLADERTRIRTLEGRFLALVTLLSANLLALTATLAVKLMG